MLEYNVVECGDKMEKMVIMLHGYGSNKDDLINLVPEINKYCQNTVFITCYYIKVTKIHCDAETV